MVRRRYADGYCGGTQAWPVHDQANPKAGAAIWSAISIDIAS
jgi:hypothetical protein